MPPRPSTSNQSQSLDDDDLPLIDGGQGVNHTPYGYRGYDGPTRDDHGTKIKGDDLQRIEWNLIKVQVFRLQNGVILQAHTEIEAGAYRNKGAVLVDTVYRDD